jgi:hypothetical protein
MPLLAKNRGCLKSFYKTQHRSIRVLLTTSRDDGDDGDGLFDIETLIVTTGIQPCFNGCYFEALCFSMTLPISCGMPTMSTLPMQNARCPSLIFLTSLS